MTEYQVTGTFEPGGQTRDFARSVEAENEDVAVERTYAELGSKHRLKRTQIEVDDVQPAEEE
ncbi:MAG: 50S ribosomal protein L18Ae [Halobacteriales archaeon]